MNTRTDSQLVTDYQNGNESALEALIRRHQNSLFTFIFYKVGDSDLANDIFQDTFMKIILTLKESNYREEGKFVFWAKRIASNMIIDFYRRQPKGTFINEKRYDDDDFSIFDMIGDGRQNVEEELVTNQIYENLATVMALLPEDQQAALKMRFFDDMSFKEIADQMDTSINTALGRIRYAIKNLRKILKDHENILMK